jgi:hypothetical protein
MVTILNTKLIRRVALMRMMKFDAKNVMINEKGSGIWYAIYRRFIPKRIKKMAISARIIWVASH